MARWPVLATLATLVRAQSYSEALAKKLVLLSDAAYCGDAQHGGTGNITQWTCAPCRSGAPLSDVSVFANPSRQTFGFAGLTDGWDEGLYIVVSFRGSVLRYNYVDDYDAVPMLSPSGRAGWVHRGMYLAFASLKDDMLGQVRGLLARAPDAKGILVTGHSLGAAQAVLAADELAAAHPRVEVTTISFGTPRVGDWTFVKRLNATPNLKAWAVAHRADTVPECGIYGSPCPLSRMVYHQLAHGVWYPDGLAPAGPDGYILCEGGEDPRCENSVPQKLLNWGDHNLYLGHTMWCCDGGSHGKSGEGCPFPFGGSSSSAAVLYA